MKDRLINRFEFPKKSIVNRILAKDIIVGSGQLTPKEKEYLISEIERVYILAVLNERSTNIPALKTEQYLYEEILCLFVQLRASTKTEQLIKLFHLIFPNPVFLIIGLPEKKLILSTCHKRLNLQDDSKVVREEIKSTEPFHLENDVGYNKLVDSTVFSKLPFSDLYQSYNWIHNNIGLSRAIQYIDRFPRPEIDREKMIQGLDNVEDLCNAILAFKREQKRAIEFNKKMDWHMKIKRKEQQMKKEIDVLKEMN